MHYGAIGGLLWAISTICRVYPLINLTKEKAAFEMLKWAHSHDRVISEHASFDPHLAESGFYTTQQKKRSDAAFDKWEEDHPFISSPELAASRELQKLDPLDPTFNYSPTKAKDSFYTRELKRRTIRSNPPGQSPQRSIAKRKKTRRLFSFFGA